MTRDPEDHADTPQAATTPVKTRTVTTPSASTPAFYALSSYYLAEIEAAMKRAVYDEVADAVLKHQLTGMLHRGGTDIRLPLPGGVQSKPLPEILLKNTPDLRDRLDQLAMMAVSKQIMKTAGRGTSLDTLNELGSLLDFDKMVAVARRQQKAQSRSKPVGSRKPKS